MIRILVGHVAPYFCSAAVYHASFSILCLLREPPPRASFLCWAVLLCYDYATMRIVEKAQVRSAPEIDRTWQRLRLEIGENGGGTQVQVLYRSAARGVPLA